MTTIPRYAPTELLAGEDLASALTFMAQARPLRGTSYDNDERFEHGRSVILRWLACCAEGESAEQTPPADLLYECAEVLYFLGNLEPRHVKDYGDESDTAQSGGCRVLEWIERRLLRVSGYDEKRPHQTAGEKLDESMRDSEAKREAEAQRQGATVN